MEENNTTAFPRVYDITIFVRNYLHGDDFPESDWIRISDFWDVNLWTKGNTNLITMYPVYNNAADTSRGITWIYRLVDPSKKLKGEKS